MENQKKTKKHAQHAGQNLSIMMMIESGFVLLQEGMRRYKMRGKQVFLSFFVIEKLDKIREVDKLSYSQAITKLFKMLNKEH